MKSFHLIVIIAFVFVVQLMAQKAGNAIQFDGIDDYMLVPHHQSLNPGNESWTICLWIKAANEILRSPMIVKRLPVDGYNQYSLGIGDVDAHDPVPGKKLYTNYIDSVAVSERSGMTINDFVDGNWHHIAMVADKAKDSIMIYIDGIRQGFDLQYSFGAWPYIDNVDSLFVAHNNVSRFYKGEMDELSLWSKALSTDQINAVKSDTLSPAYYSSADSGLVAYYRFDEFEDLGVGGGLNDIRDFSVWSNHGGTEGLPLLVLSGILLSVEDDPTIIPAFHLKQNYPNPFNPSTKISWQSPLGSWQTLKVYDVLGNVVATLVSEEKPAGEYEVEFNVSLLSGSVSAEGGYASGVYFYQLKAGNFVETKKMILLR